MSLQTIHLTQGDHNAALVACQHPDTTYKLCKLWGEADRQNREAKWQYVAGWIDGIDDMQAGAGRFDAHEELVFLHSIALARSLMAWEVNQ